MNGFSRARMSQMLGLLNLAPVLQEQLLFLEPLARGRQVPVLFAAQLRRRPSTRSVTG
jgi:hypothetical protein